MAGLSVYARNRLLDLAFGATSYSRPATVYLEPYTVLPGETGNGGTVPSGNGYSGRTAVTSATFFAAASGGAKSNALAAVLGTCSGGTWGTLAGVGIWDASSSGNLLALVEFETALVTVSGKRVKLRAGSLTVTCAGAWSTAFANALLDHAFGGPDYTPPGTWYAGLLTDSAELSGNGYARTGLTNNTTNFPNASSGAKSTAAIAFGPASGAWSQATRLGFFAASSGGAAAVVDDFTIPRTVSSGETATADAGAISVETTFTEPEQESQTPGIWVDVTPAGIDLTPSSFGNDNFGVQDVWADPVRPSDLYAFVCHQGVWKSTDYGVTWTGPINTGTGGSLVTAGKPWGCLIDRQTRSPSTPPRMLTCAGNAHVGCLRSDDGGVSWTAYSVDNDDSSEPEDVYCYDQDPYDPDHVLCGMHGYGISESFDFGETWTQKNFVVPDMGGSCYPWFVDTGDAESTALTWLSVSDSPTNGTWITFDGGETWTRLGDRCHDHGNHQAAVLGNGVMYSPGGGGGGGIWRTLDGGETWTQVTTEGANGVVATPTRLYSSYAAAIAAGGLDPNLRSALRAADTDWDLLPDPPAGLDNGWKRCAVTTHGAARVLVAGCWNAGIWRYVEA